MRVRKEQIDSEILGKSVLEILDFDPGSDFLTFERSFCDTYNPIYAVCRIPSEQMIAIHALENYGFRFAEFRIKLRGSTRKIPVLDPTGYSFLRVDPAENLEPLLALASSTIQHDRISRDPYFKKWTDCNIAGERYRRYVLRSLASDNEFVHKLVDDSTGEIVAFHTHRILTPDTALLLLGGVRSDLKNLGIGVMNEYFSLHELKRKGVRTFHTHVSGSNCPILNLEVNLAQFRVVETFVVLRKVYEDVSSERL